MALINKVVGSTSLDTERLFASAAKQDLEGMAKAIEDLLMQMQTQINLAKLSQS